MKIKRLIFDWYTGPYGEEFKEYQIGIDAVTDIKEHGAQGEGDKWFYDVSFSDATMERIFNPNKVFFES